MLGVLDKIRTAAASAPGYFESGVEAHERKQYLKALEHWRRANACGHAEAQYRIGMLYARGEGVAHSMADAVVWYRRAAEAGVVEAQFQLGLIYLHGHEPYPGARRSAALAANRLPA